VAPWSPLLMTARKVLLPYAQREGVIPFLYYTMSRNLGGSGELTVSIAQILPVCLSKTVPTVVPNVLFL